MSNKKTQIAGALFFLYVLWMLWLLFGQRMGQSSSATYWQRLQANLNLQPMDTLRRFWWVLQYSENPTQIRHAIINLGGNVVMFLPLGGLTPMIWPRLQKFWRHGITMVMIIAVIELVQLFTLLGSCDVDDLILNLVGTTLGFFLWKLSTWIHQKK